MRSHRGRASALWIVLALTAGSSASDEPGRSSTPPKKVLVELFSVPDSRSAQATSNLVGRLAKLGYGPDRVVLLSFPAEARDEPEATRRRADYGAILGGPDLVGTPRIVVDGRDPVVGPDQLAMLAALGRAAREPSKVALDLSLAGTGSRRTLSARIAVRSRSIQGREVVIGVALAEDPATTRAADGRTQVEHQVVRRFAGKLARLDVDGPQTLTFPVELLDPRGAARSRLTAFVQDRLDGTVYQAESIPWPVADPSRGVAARRRKPSAPLFVYLPPIPSSDQPPSCLDCGTPFSSEFVDSLPPGYDFRHRPKLQNVSPPTC